MYTDILEQILQVVAEAQTAVEKEKLGLTQ